MNPFLEKTYAQALDAIVERYGDREALVWRDQRFTFRDMRQRVDRASARLASIGLAPDDKLSIWLPNRPDYIWYLLGASQMGLVPVVLNTHLTSEEVAYQLRQSDSRAVIVPGEGAFRDFLGEIVALCPELARCRPGTLRSSSLPDLRWVLSLDPFGAELPGVLDWSGPADALLPVPPPARDPGAPALIAYSSGTTALPKGAMINHCVWRKAWDIGERLDFTEADRLYLAIPMFGSMATMNGIFPLWVRGGGVVLAERFDAGRTLQAWQAERCTFMHLLPPMVKRLCEHPDLERYDRRSMRVAVVLSNERSLLEAVVERLGIPGMITGYGLTETTTVLTRNRWDAPLEVRIATQGHPLPDVELRVVDPDSGDDLPKDQVGEILVRSYCVTPGYYNKPEETRRAFTADGWFRTGDAGRLDEHQRLAFVGRIGDGYKTKGFNVSPAEVEAAIRSHTDVGDVAVVGLPDPVLGAVGVAFVVPANDGTADAEDILAHARKHLAGFKVPGHVLFVESFPRTSGTGKVQKFRLREVAAETLVPAGRAVPTARGLQR